MSEGHVDGPTDAELCALLLLLHLPGIGSVSARRLLQQFGSAAAAVRAPATLLGAEAAEARCHPWLHERALRGVRAIRDLGAHTLLENDARYPECFRTLAEPPAVVFALGELSLLERRRVAIVGTRRNTEYGADVARTLAAGLVYAGIVVVSGLARGIDSCAHDAALQNNGDTIALLGTGIDVAYPPEHVALQRRIAERGLLLTEVPPGLNALSHHFPRRNRLIAALSEAVVVVEAPPKSGALNTASLALDMGKEVMAVPGPIGRDTSEGTNALIRDGAGLVTCVDDILDAIHAPASSAPGMTALPAPAGPNVGVLNALGHEVRHVDEVALQCGMRGAETLIALLELELGGWVRQLPGKRFARARA